MKGFQLLAVIILMSTESHCFSPASYVLPGGEGIDYGDWSEWGEPSPCSRTCGSGVASQKRICLVVGPNEVPSCMGGDTRYFSCETQECLPEAKDFRAEQCSEFDDVDFKGNKYKWEPYTKAPNPCELNCMPHGERFYYRHKTVVTDGTRCTDDSFDVCVQGVCQPVGCDMMLGSSAKEDKCRVCRGNGTNCNTYNGVLDKQDLIKGYNDLLRIPEGATNIEITELLPSQNYIALRAENGTYYLNGDYHINVPGSMKIAGALWHYDKRQGIFLAQAKLQSLGPITETLILSILLQSDNVGVQYEYSLPKVLAPQPNPNFKWVHDDFTACTETCGGGQQTRNVTCRSHEDLDVVDESLCEAELRPDSQQTCNTQACQSHWNVGPWSECGPDGNRSRHVYCENTMDGNWYGLSPSVVVSDAECVAPKPNTFEECNDTNVSYSTWFTGPWKPCDKLCGEGKQTREVKCMKRVLENDDCLDDQPPAEQPCFGQFCDDVDWVVTDWIGCDSCGSKERTRLAECVTKDFVVVDTNYCTQTKPALIEPCDPALLPFCRPKWYFELLNQHKYKWCGLIDGDSVVLVEASRCAELPKNSSTSSSNETGRNIARWYAGPWSQCTKDCDTGEQYRLVMCLQAGKVAMNCTGESVLSSTQLCNTQSCDNSSSTNNNNQNCEKDRTHIHDTKDGTLIEQTTEKERSSRAKSACDQRKDRGPCHNYTTLWYYDIEYGGCSRFWYGGCEGNGNKFVSREECEDVCVHPPPKDVCNLPMVTGPCLDFNIRWYYNSALELCEPFNYGGCTGNANNFLTVEACLQQCNPPGTPQSPDVCTLPAETGSCANYREQWYYDTAAKRCTQFYYGGCGGNGNRFATEQECKGRCAEPQTTTDQSIQPVSELQPSAACGQRKDPGPCHNYTMLWYYDIEYGGCWHFWYGGCEGNGNKFVSREECEDVCVHPPPKAPDVCTLPAETGSCTNYTEQWYYDTAAKRCTQFYYGGCGGNGNRFATEQECKGRCAEPQTTTDQSIQPVSELQPSGGKRVAVAKAREVSCVNTHFTAHCGIV